MIQRIQTVYLFFIVLTISLLLWANPVFYKITGVDKWTNGGEGTVEVSVLKIDRKLDNTPLLTLFNSYLIYSLSIVSFLALVAIFLFKNRRLQLLLCGFNYLFMAISAVLFYVYLLEGSKWVALPSTSEFNYLILGVLVLFVLNYLAMRGILRDEKLIRSMDRIR